MKFSTGTGGKTSGLGLTESTPEAGNSLVRMGRLELPRPLQALEPKSSASANSATSARSRRVSLSVASQRSAGDCRVCSARSSETLVDCALVAERSQSHSARGPSAHKTEWKLC